MTQDLIKTTRGLNSAIKTAKLLLLSTMALALFSCSSGSKNSDSQTETNTKTVPEMPISPPGGGEWNVLFISVDDLNTWTGHLQGHPNAKTPNIDEFAKTSTSFARAYSPVPACNPTRAAILSGVRPSYSGIYLNNHDWDSRLGDVETLPQTFKTAGYYTVGSGKIFHNGEAGHTAPEYWTEYTDFEDTFERREVPGVTNVNGIRWGAYGTEDEHGDHRRTLWAIDKLNQKHDKPFFIGVGYIKPHMWWVVPQKYFDMHPLETIQTPPYKENDLDDVPPMGVEIATNTENQFYMDHKRIEESGKWKEAIRGYLASSTYADEKVGMILDALDASPYRDNTIVIIWGDHGWHLGEKYHWRKHALWEEATRTTYMVRVPGLTKGNEIVDTPVDLMSMYPTLLDITGIKRYTKPSDDKYPFENISIAPLLSDPNHSWDRPAIMSYGAGNMAVRDARYRLIQYADGTQEFYDHSVDPNEWENIAAKPEIQEAKARLVEYIPTEWAPKGDCDARFRGIVFGGCQ